MRFDLGTLDSGERSLPFGLLVPQLTYPTLQSPLPHPSHLFPSLPYPRFPYLPYSTLPSLPYYTLPSTTLPLHPLPTYLPSHHCHIFAFPTLCSPHTRPLASPPLIPYPTLSPTLPYPSGLSRLYHTILSPLLFPCIPSLPTLIPPSYPCIPYRSLPSHPLPDRSRGRNIFFPTSLGYLNPSLLYPPLSYHPNAPLHYATHLLPTLPLFYPRIPSTSLISPALIPYRTASSPSPTLSSHLLSSPTSPYSLP